MKHRTTPSVDPTVRVGVQLHPRTHKHLEEILSSIAARFKFMPLADAVTQGSGSHRIAVVRHDVEKNVDRVLKVARLENKLGIQGSYYFRVACPDYNVCSYQWVRAILEIKAMGHEIGLHSEALDLAEALRKTPEECLSMEISVLMSVAGDFSGIAPHRSPTGKNNIDWFAKEGAAYLNGFYNAYDTELPVFPGCDYLSDSHIYHWTRYRDGKLLDEPECICGELEELQGPIYMLLHPHLWFSNHYYL